MVSFLEAFSSKRFVCCTLTEVYSTYSTVGRRPQRYIHLGLYISAIGLPTILYVRPQWYIYLGLYISAIDLPTILYVRPQWYIYLGLYISAIDLPTILYVRPQWYIYLGLYISAIDLPTILYVRPQWYIYLGLYISAIDLPTILYVLHIHLQLRSSKMTPLQKWPVLTLTPQPIHCTPHCFQVHKSSEGDAAMRVQDMLSLSHEADLVGQ